MSAIEFVAADGLFGATVLVDGGGALHRFSALPDGRSVQIEDTDGIVRDWIWVRGRLMLVEEVEG